MDPPLTKKPKSTHRVSACSQLHLPDSRLTLDLVWTAEIEGNEMENQMIGELDPSYYVNQLQPVLHAAETRPIEFVSVYISDVSNLKLISKIIAYLGTYYPLDSLSHLKRIRKVQTEDPNVWRTQILVGLVSVLQTHSESQKAILKDIYGLILQEYQVPRYEPLMKAQYESWTKTWPITLKAHIPSTPSPMEAFSTESIQHFVSCMRRLIPLATEAGNACMILAPSGLELSTVASTSDTVLSHCCINLITLVANHQLKESNNTQYTHHKRNSVDHAPDPKPIDYLCNGCTVLVVREPCIMCSMALLHSRVACVIYAVPNPSSGGLGSRFSIHCETRLNHHFHVYKGLLQHEVPISAD